MPRRNAEQRRADREAGVDRFGRPLPSRLEEEFDPFDFRCYICGDVYELPKGAFRFGMAAYDGRVTLIHPPGLVVVSRLHPVRGVDVPYAYRCRAKRACLTDEAARNVAEGLAIAADLIAGMRGGPPK